MIKKIFKIIISGILCVVLLVASLAIYITFIERNLLVVKKEKIIINEYGDDSLKIVQFTDTHLGGYYSLEQLEKLVNKINKLDADIVVFTGDLIDNASQYNDEHKIAEVLKKIQCNIGKYAVYGNRDYGGGAVRYYNDIMEESGFTILKNQQENLKYKDKDISIFGGDDALLGNHNEHITMKGIDKDSINILLLHEPDLIDKYSDYPIDLALSGHSHGGQVYIPYFGPIKKNVLSQTYNKGMYELDNDRNTRLYVSSGIGNTKVPFRFFNVPEIAVFNLKI